MYVTTEELRTEIKIVNQDLRVLAKEINGELQGFHTIFASFKESLEDTQKVLNNLFDRIERLEKNHDIT